MEPPPRTATPIALTIAGSDSSGAAGLQSDLRAFDALGVHGTSVVTLVTAQGSRRFRKMDALRADLVRAQLAAVTEPVAPRAVKVGALGNAAVVEIVADVLRALRDAPLVLDPVISPRDGRVLLDDSGYASFVRELLPLATLILPNRDEAARLAGAAVKTPRQMRAACQAIVALGARAVLLKGGHFEGPESVDLYFNGSDFVELRAPRLPLPPMGGLGSVLSALITAWLARGEPMERAVPLAHAALHRAMRSPRALGEGVNVLGDLRDAVREPEIETPK